MDYDELFPPELDPDTNLFDNPLDTSISGNDDPLDKVKKICLICGMSNGEHDSSCHDNF